MGGGFAAVRQRTWGFFPTLWEIPAASDNGRLKLAPLAFVALITVGERKISAAVTVVAACDGNNLFSKCATFASPVQRTGGWQRMSVVSVFTDNTVITA